MVELDYYDPWYQSAPWWHKGLGLSVLFLLLLRFIWRLINTTPTPLINDPAHNLWLIRIAEIVHNLFYILLVIICLSGYFISTAKGVGIEVFNWFNLPSIMTLNDSQADLSATIHETVTQFLIFLVVIHTAAAFKHHFINKDKTLIRILKVTQSKENTQ